MFIAYFSMFNVRTVFAEWSGFGPIQQVAGVQSSSQIVTTNKPTSSF